MAAYIFCFFTLSKGKDDAHSSLGYVFSTKSLFAFYSLQHHMHIHHRRDVSIIARVVKNTKCAGTRKYLKGNLCSSAAYNQGWLTIE